MIYKSIIEGDMMNKKIVLICLYLVNFIYTANAANIEKSEALVTLVKEAIHCLASNSVEASCQNFTHKIDPSKSNMFIFMLNDAGNILCFGDHAELIWQNIISAKNSDDKVFRSTNDKSVLENIYVSAKQGNWVKFFWNNIEQKAYVKEVNKDGARFIIGAGFYPTCNQYKIIQQSSLLFSKNSKHEMCV